MRSKIMRMKEKEGIEDRDGGKKKIEQCERRKTKTVKENESMKRS